MTGVFLIESGGSKEQLNLKVDNALCPVACSRDPRWLEL